MADDMSIDNKPNPPHGDESDDSLDSHSPLERDDNAPPAPVLASGNNGNRISSNSIDSINAVQDAHAQQPKRKGGRKPVSLSLIQLLAT